MPARRSFEIYLLRHGHSTANGKGILAGRDNSVALSEKGNEQALAAADFLTETKFDQIISSPIFRCQETLYPLLESLASRKVQPQHRLDDRLAEMDYGDWSGKKLALLSKKPLWKDIQNRPSTVRFPGGESFAEMNSRTTDLLSSLSEHSGERFLLCSHGDVIKAIIAAALGLHLDQFQRIVIDPASISRILVTDTGALVRSVNDTSFHPREKVGTKSRRGSSKFLLGGGAGK